MKKFRRVKRYRLWQLLFVTVSSLLIIGLVSMIVVHGSFDSRSQAAGSETKIWNRICTKVCTRKSATEADRLGIAQCLSICNRIASRRGPKDPTHPSPTHIPVSTTPRVSTGTPTHTPTRLPVNTGAPSSGTNGAISNAPLCSAHNDIAWHGLWDAVRGCHYDHTHNDNPTIGNAIFGPAGAAWGQNISYPWMTLNENNEHGHQGYKYYVNTNPSPACAFEGYEYLNPQHCVSAFRIQYHDAGGNAHMVKRFHSYFMEAQIKSKNGTTTGIIRTGGHADFGCLHKSYKESFLPLPGIDPVNSSGDSVCGNGHSIHSDPYRAPMKTLDEIQGMRSGDNPWIWTAHNKFGYNRFGFFFFRTLDSFGSIDPANPYAEHFICAGEPGCKYNNSEHNVFNVYIMIPSSLDADGDGIVNYTGYTDIKGNIAQGCTAASTTCVPLQIINAPVGTAIWSRNLSGIRPEGDPIRDHDVYFNGRTSGWIQFMAH